MEDRQAICTHAGAASLLLLTLAYWWQSNLVHELAGLGMFALVSGHIYLNRAWLLNLTRGQYDGRRRVVAGLHLALIINMLLLLATSIAISQSVFAILPIPDNVTVRDLHWLAAYWLVMTVGVHLGLHWNSVMALLRSAFGIAGASEVRRWSFRFAVLALLAAGLWSAGLMDLAAKLSWNRSLNFWDFSVSVAPFFVHWAAVLAVPAIATHYVKQAVPAPTGR